ncbi:MAG: hypothetical protein H6672_06135 [Anaerolineaceae bacterium]|nr:hypothetical protein [Anaerolineaceae bacterium]
MLRYQPQVAPENRSLNRLFIVAFALLALGDTGHVGFRVLAYAQGDLDTTFNLLGGEVGLVGLGALSTAITVTFFYVLMLVIWHERTGKPYGWFGMLLFAAAVVRLVLMAFPQNDWNSSVPPQPWSLIRNAPLMLQGFGVAYLILRDAWLTNDGVFKWIGISILVSFGFYTPVILFVQQSPAIGMLMIPKTLAYVAIAAIAYVYLFRRGEPAARETARQGT